MAQKSITEVQNRVLGGFATTIRNSKNDKTGGLSSAFKIRKSKAVQPESSVRYSVNAMINKGSSKSDVISVMKK